MNSHPSCIVVCLGLMVAATAASAQPSAPTSTATDPTAPPDPNDAGTRSAPAGDNAFARWLEGYGVNLRGSEIDQYARNVAGGVREGHTNVGQFNIGADLNLEKMFGLSGTLFHFVVYRDYGFALNQNFTGTFTKQQYIYKNPYPQIHLGLFAFEQKLLDDRLDIWLGRLGSTTYYGHLATNCQFISGTLCGEPRMIVSEAGLSLLPSATWGTNIKYRPTTHTYAETGIYEVNPTTAPSNGLHFSVAQATGFTVPAELGWTNTDATATRYPFELKMGAYVSTAPLSDPYYNTHDLSRALHGGTARQDSFNRDGVYLMGDRVIWRPDPAGTASLNVFGGVVQQLEEAEIVRQQIYTGLVWTAPFNNRPRDTLGLSVSEFELTPGERDYLRDARIKAGGTGSNSAHQFDYEVTYSLHLVRGVELMASLQYIIHPDNSTIPNTPILPGNLLVYGLGLRMDLGYMAGFLRGASSD
jgi:porin